MYDFKYFYQILIIYTQLYVPKKLLLINKNYLFAQLYISSK